jgi:hypothetical protein
MRMQIILGFRKSSKKTGVKKKLMIYDILSAIQETIHQKMNLSSLSFNHFR